MLQAVSISSLHGSKMSLTALHDMQGILPRSSCTFRRMRGLEILRSWDSVRFGDSRPRSFDHHVIQNPCCRVCHESVPIRFRSRQAALSSSSAPLGACGLFRDSRTTPTSLVDRVQSPDTTTTVSVQWSAQRGHHQLPYFSSQRFGIPANTLPVRQHGRAEPEHLLVQTASIPTLTGHGYPYHNPAGNRIGWHGLARNPLNG
jgi:hypothetical protein